MCKDLGSEMIKKTCNQTKVKGTQEQMNPTTSWNFFHINILGNKNIGDNSVSI